MLKWLKRIALGLLALVAALTVVGIGYEEWSRRHFARTLAPAGRLIDVGGHRLHLRCTGTGTPTVVLESGGDALGSQSWFAVRPALAGTTRVCAYDRAGYGWSDTAPEPRDALTISTELHRLLRRASEPPPFVLVGHSAGGAFIRVFADRYPDDVAGLVFVDSSHPEMEERLPPEMSMDRPIVRIAEWAIRIAARTGALRLMASLDPPSGAPETFGAFYPQGVAALTSEFDAFHSTMAQDREARIPGELPLVVLSAGQRFASIPDELRERVEGIDREMQSELAALSANSDHRILEDAGHYVQLDDPEAVIRAVADVVAAVRDDSPLGSLRR